jgi:hypothetical protein
MDGGKTMRKLLGMTRMSVVGGFFLMRPLVILFDSQEWPMFHQWLPPRGT